MKFFRIFDLFIYLSVLFSLIFGFTYFFSMKSREKSLKIISQKGEFVYSLDEKKTLDFQVDEGVIVVEIEDGKARILSSPCRDKICVHRSWISELGEWAACMPNSFMILIVSSNTDGGVDAVSF